MSEVNVGKPVRSSTFIITIHYQQNGSWQGTIRWTNGRKEQCFRSELELITLIDEAVQAGNTAADTSAEAEED